MTVYIVDDDQSAREAACNCVVSAGYKVKTYASGEDFLSDYNPKETGCIVSDYLMSGVSGLDIQKVLRSRGCMNPMVFVSGLADVNVAVQAMRHGATHFLEKPYSPKDLICAVEEAVGKAVSMNDARIKLERLKTGECDTLWLMLEGLPNKMIKARLGIGLRTVERRRHEVFRKTEVNSEVQLDELVRRAGWARPKADGWPEAN